MTGDVVGGGGGSDGTGGSIVRAYVHVDGQQLGGGWPVDVSPASMRATSTR